MEHFSPSMILSLIKRIRFYQGLVIGFLSALAIDLLLFSPLLPYDWFLVWYMIKAMIAVPLLFLILMTWAGHEAKEEWEEWDD